MVEDTASGGGSLSSPAPAGRPGQVLQWSDDRTYASQSGRGVAGDWYCPCQSHTLSREGSLRPQVAENLVDLNA